MPISLNGGNNPSAVYYNSTNLDAVYFAPNGNSDFTQVWGVEAAYPTTISLIRAYNSYTYDHEIYGNPQGSYDIYMRDLTFRRHYYLLYPSTGRMEYIVEYSSQDCSFDFDWPAGKFAGYIFPPSDVSGMQQQLGGSAATVSGVPSFFSGFDLVVDAGFSYPFDFDWRNATYTQSGRTTVTLQFNTITLYTNSSNTIWMDPVSTPLVLDSDAAWCFWASTGFVTQQPATLKFVQPL